MTIQFARDELSVRKPAWTPISLRVPIVDSPVLQFVFVQTVHGIYDRAKVIKESPNAITIEYTKKSNVDSAKVEKKIETLRKSEILVLRNYKN